MRSRTIVVLAALFLAACGAEAGGAPEAELGSANSPNAGDLTEEPREVLPPSPLALVNEDDELCVTIHYVLDTLMRGELGSASDYADVEQELPSALRGQATTGPVPTVSSETRSQAAAVDEHTLERCGVPFVQSNIHIALTCATAYAEGPFAEHIPNWGSCTDPRLDASSVVSLDAQMDSLEVLEQAIQARFE